MGEVKTLISVISGFSDVSPSPKTIYLYLSRHQDTSNNSRKNATQLKKTVIFEILEFRKCHTIKKNCYFWNIRISELEHLETWTILVFVGNLEYGINIFQKAWNGLLVSLKLWNFETLKLWNFETKKPTNKDTKKPRNPETTKPRTQETKKLWNQEIKKP